MAKDDERGGRPKSTQTAVNIAAVADLVNNHRRMFMFKNQSFVWECHLDRYQSNLSIRFYNSCRRLPETKRHSALFLHLSCSKFLAVMAACTPSIRVFLGRLFLLSSGIHSIINFGILSSDILLTWPYQTPSHRY
jgi:hypothetical protein